MRKFKKIISLLLSVALIMAYVPLGAYAAEKTIIKVGKVEGRPNEIVSVPVTISNNTGIAGFLFAVSYDTDVLEAVSVECGKDLTIGTLMDNLSNEDRTALHIMWFSADEFTGNGEVAVIKFKIKSKEANEYPLAVKYKASEIRNSSAAIDAEVIGGSVRNTGFIRGDFDNDGKVSLTDVISGIMHIMNPNIYTITEEDDFNNDGFFDTNDMIYLTKHINNPNQYPL